MPKCHRETQFLNVDLNIQSKANLAPLVKALEKKVFVLCAERYQGTFYVNIEIGKRTKDADSTIRALCKLIASLPPKERALWNRARRMFNIGICAGVQPNTYGVYLPATTLNAVTEIGAGIVLTLYGAGFGLNNTRSRKSAKASPSV